MTAPEHSPLPWRIDHDGDIVDADDHWIKIIGGRERSVADAQLIVAAVNVRAELLAAAKEALYYIEDAASQSGASLMTSDFWLGVICGSVVTFIGTIMGAFLLFVERGWIQ